MYDRMPCFSPYELTLIHDAAVEILSQTGLGFNSEPALALFRNHGFRIDGKRVLIPEAAILKALEQTPSGFTVRARNDRHSLTIDENAIVFAPTAGAPYVAGVNGELRPASYADYQTCCKLVQSSDQLDMTAFGMVQPMDLPPRTAHLEMLSASILLCDKPFMAAASSAEAVSDSMELAALVYGGREKLLEQPVTVTIVNPKSPLQYSEEMAGLIMAMARFRQPVAITNMILAGSSGPVSLAGILALLNAEILGGIVLAQLAGPATPVIYGSISAPLDMKTAAAACGAPETLMLASATVQLARFYHLPCRTGGMLTDAHRPDAQALAESTLLLSGSVRSGSNFVLHACGQMGSFISLNFEKWLIDEEICRSIRCSLNPIRITPEAIDVETIKSVGMDGQYLTHPKTFEHYRSLSQPVIFNRRTHSKWSAAGGKAADQVAVEALGRRLENFVPPPIDEGLERAVIDYVTVRKNGALVAA